MAVRDCCREMRDTFHSTRRHPALPGRSRRWSPAVAITANVAFRWLDQVQPAQPRPAAGRASLAGQGLVPARAGPQGRRSHRRRRHARTRPARPAARCWSAAASTLPRSPSAAAPCRAKPSRQGAPTRRAPPAGSMSSSARPHRSHGPGVRRHRRRLQRGRLPTSRIAPQTFSVLVRSGTRLNQLRLKRGEPPALSVRPASGSTSAPGVAGYRARRHAGVVDLDRENSHDPRDFWEPLEPRRGELLLDPGEILHHGVKGPGRGSRCWRRPEMTPIDPGGAGRVPGALRRLLRPRLRHRRDRQCRRPRASWEVRRTTETPFHCSKTARSSPGWSTQPLTERPTRLDGENGSHYQRQGLKLSKHFRAMGVRGGGLSAAIRAPYRRASPIPAHSSALAPGRGAAGCVKVTARPPRPRRWHGSRRTANPTVFSCTTLTDQSMIGRKVTMPNWRRSRVPLRSPSGCATGDSGSRDRARPSRDRVRMKLDIPIRCMSCVALQKCPGGLHEPADRRAC